jgi:hypothetical protein
MTSASAQRSPEAVQARYELEAGGLETELLWLKQIGRPYLKELNKHRKFLHELVIFICLCTSYNKFINGLCYII